MPDAVCSAQFLEKRNSGSEADTKTKPKGVNYGNR
jgi:hypothetical protein